MRVPLSWLREYADLPPVTPRDVAEKLIGVGLEVERVQSVGHEVKNVVVGEVLEIEELAGVKKPMRYCRVEVGEHEARDIVCGATNFDVGARVPVALPGGILPGGFEIGVRKAYGRMSEGMICSARELGLGEDHTGILVLDGDPPIGADAVELLQLRDDVLDIDVLPDRGYCLSVRGLAREAATAYGVGFRDPASADLPAAEEGSYPASIADPTACDRFVLRAVSGFDPTRGTPLWMQRRLTLAGMRPVSLAVDITNYLMIELGQPIHAFDGSKLHGEIVVRRARPGERLETLDHVVRELDPDDILITDSSGPISMAGTMGGLSTEIDDASTDMVVEAAHFSAAGTARMSRRHRLSSEASYRFERGVDRELPLYASAKAVRLLAELGGATVLPGRTHAEVDTPRTTITIAADHPGRVAGTTYGRETVVRRLRDVGCEVDGGDTLTVTAPTWRPDLRDPNDLAEEVIRLEGYQKLPSVPPQAPAGGGLTPGQRLRRRVGQALAAAGYVEVLTPPFLSGQDWDRLHLPPDDARRRCLEVANPLSEDEPLLRTTLLPGMLRALLRNVGRGFPDVSLYEMGLVYLPLEGAPAPPRLPVDRGPTQEEIASVDAALPDQPHHVAVVLAGDRVPAGWWGKGREASWADAIESAREVARAAGVDLTVSADQRAPWHPGRCAALVMDGQVVGHAGELHPRVTQAYELPARTCAMELDPSRVEAATSGPAEPPRLSAYPVATLDVALMIADDVPAADVEDALRSGAGELLESIRLFDIYTGAQVGEGRRSIAYALRFRAPDRTLTAEETTAARDAAAAEAARRTGAVLRGG
ncbi:MAG: phenylalanine--tRNA ligase subunit beta [Streptosporangiales bacterium]|nr:phenylalanine--tRNA ligase subunit beta [Streptosporangiales bacterium]